MSKKGVLIYRILLLKEFFMSKYVRILMKNGQTRCAICNVPCQGFKDPFGRILCSDCWFKIFGERPRG